MKSQQSKGVWTLTSPKTSIVTRLNDTDEGLSKSHLTKRTAIAVWTEAWKLIGLMLIFIFVRIPDKGRSHGILAVLTRDSDNRVDAEGRRVNDG
jgi:hypothetical protein